MNHLSRFWCVAFVAFLAMMVELPLLARLNAQSPKTLFERKNLVAWCIVPFDGARRSPEDRAAMLRDLGFKRFAYDYRAEHVATFEREILALKQNGVELFAWWFPTTLNAEAKLILETLKKHDVHPQLWVTGGGNATIGSEESERLFLSETERIRTLATAAQEIGCKVGLYNHGGWFGQPKVLVELVRRIDMPNVGIVFNLHHAHDQLDELPTVVRLLKPNLYTINLNGMETNGDKIGKKILPLGHGTRDKEVLQIIANSGYDGPIGILNHTDEDARVRLELNLAGLEKIVTEIKLLP